jgi:hypothetical protein
VCISVIRHAGGMDAYVRQWFGANTLVAWAASSMD